MATNFVKLYGCTILKKTVSKIAVSLKKKAKAEERQMNTSLDANSVRSMRHWRAVADVELYYKEIETGFQQLQELDELTGWSSLLHQDRYKFMNEKYSGILNEYFERSNVRKAVYK